MTTAEKRAGPGTPESREAAAFLRVGDTDGSSVISRFTAFVMIQKDA